MLAALRELGRQDAPRAAAADLRVPGRRRGTGDVARPSVSRGPMIGRENKFVFSPLFFSSHGGSDDVAPWMRPRGPKKGEMGRFHQAKAA